MFTPFELSEQGFPNNFKVLVFFWIFSGIFLMRFFSLRAGSSLRYMCDEIVTGPEMRICHARINETLMSLVVVISISV